MNATMNKKRTASKMIHPGSKEAQPALKPLGVDVRISEHAKGLIEDARLESCRFGAAQTANDVQFHWVSMQMRGKDLAEYVAELEKQNSQYRRDAVMKF